MSALYSVDKLSNRNTRGNQWPSGTHGQVTETNNWEYFWKVPCDHSYKCPLNWLVCRLAVQTWVFKIMCPNQTGGAKFNGSSNRWVHTLSWNVSAAAIFVTIKSNGAIMTFKHSFSCFESYFQIIFKNCATQ